MKELLRHTCTSAKIARVAYDAEDRALFIEFKPKLSCYRYEGVERKHFDYISNCKTAFENSQLERVTDSDLQFTALDAPKDVTPGSEGSYIVRVIVGTDRKNPPFPFRRLDDVEAADIFPFVPDPEVAA